MSGVIRLGERSSELHGLASCECGLLSLMRCYHPLDHANILKIFEQASAHASRFCFSTSLVGSDVARPVICMGESGGHEDGQSGAIRGVFIFPHLS